MTADPSAMSESGESSSTPRLASDAVPGSRADPAVADVAAPPGVPALREVRPDDAKAIERLLAAMGYADTGAFVARRISEQIAHPDALTLVAEDDAKVVQAFASLHFIPQIALAGDFCRISYFCVAPHLRSLGWGARFEQHIVAVARARGCDRIELHSHSRRVDAHRFYERLGYSESPKYLLKLLT